MSIQSQWNVLIQIWYLVCSVAILSVFRMKKMLDDDESSVEVSVHQQPLVTKSCYHQDRDLNKRQNTAAKLRPKVESRILQLTNEVQQPSRHLSIYLFCC